MCSSDLEINEEKFFIERTAKMNKKGDAVKVDVNFWRLEGDDVVSLNGTERRDTDKAIESYLGKYEDFVLTALSLQGNNSLFIDKSQSERKDLLAQFMGLNIFDKLYDTALEDIREVSVLIKNFKKTDFTTELADKGTQIKDEKSALKELQQHLNSETKIKEGIEGEILDLTRQLAPIDSTLDIDKLDAKKKEINTKLPTELSQAPPQREEKKEEKEKKSEHSSLTPVTESDAAEKGDEEPAPHDAQASQTAGAFL